MMVEKKLKTTGAKKTVQKKTKEEGKISSDEKRKDKIPSDEKKISSTFDFQVSDWNSYHEIDGDDEERYVMQSFGRTEDDKDVCLKINGFTPFFYAEVPNSWNEKQADKFVDILKNKVQWCTSNNPNYEYDLSNSLIRHRLVQKKKFYNFSNNKLFKFVMLVFKSHTAMREFANVLARPLKASGLTKTPMLYQRYESNIEPHLRFMHINNLSSCGWISVDKSKLKVNKEYSDCDYSYEVNWKDIKPSDNDNRIAPFKIMGYDIECISCDHNFPQANRKTDKIIQIGITMYRYGSMNCYEQHILTMKNCTEIKGANVECYKTEKGLIRGFAKKLSEIRPDFKTGYNNFGFDDKYIYDRIMRIDKETADKLETNIELLENKFIDEILQTMGKVNNKYLVETEQIDRTVGNRHANQPGGTHGGPSLTYFEVKNLSSSALGDNELKFFQVPGIIPIDMMKVIMREYRLVGYKLDNVSANFITEEAIKINNKDDEVTDDGKITIDVYTKSTKALEKDSYIQIMVDDGYSSSPLSEGAKYKVLDIQTIKEKIFNAKEQKEEELTYQCIKTIISQKDASELTDVIANPLLKVYWTFAKDDMHHTLINKFFKEGDPNKIKRIAKYCLKDCKLVNLLLAKLEIIVNNIGMAKVCHVPLSYLFLRGQGVKIFSLVSKKCREKDFLIPVLRKKKKDANGDDDETYEGATVITPKPAVYLSPIGVLDYSSLYPNSMREGNLSQECYVNNSDYDNLPGYIYHDVHIILKDKKGKILRNIDGTPQKEFHRFAQEIITDEQINIELKDIFEKINRDAKDNIKKLKVQELITEDQRKDLIAIEKANAENKIKEIKSQKDISDKKKQRLVAEINNNIIAKLKELAEQKEITEEQRDFFLKSEPEKAKKKISDEKAKRYNVSQGKTVRYGILPEILTELLNKRKETNNKLASEKDPFIKSILNALQLAYKVTANSLYGQTGAPTSPIFFIAIAASTTAIGRERLHFAKRIVEENFPGAEVIYGDSVTGDTPLIIKDQNGFIEIKTIAELGEKWAPYEQFKMEDSNRKEKQQANVDYKIMTANGWSKIRRVIRHKTNKKIYRVATKTGCIDVTEDHSLLDKYGNKIKPMDCKIGTELLHKDIDPVNKLNDYSPEYDYDEFESIANEEFSDLKRYINSTIELKEGFISCYEPKIVVSNKLKAQLLFYLIKSIGYNVQIDLVDNNYQLTYGKDLEITNNKTIQSIEYLRETNDNEYVYDLETEDGTFHAGVGEMIVKNTDSIFINFHIKDEDGNERTDREALIKTIELSKAAAKMINDRVPKPQGIVYEKTLHPFILVAKKKYVGLLFGENPDKYYLKSMGIVLKRRDNAPIVKIVVGGIIDHILKNRDINKAVEYTKQVLRKLMDGGYPIDKFIISKTLRAKYKQNKNNKTGKFTSLPAHKILADRMAERDPGNKPQINDRIPFVYIVKDFGKKKTKDILQGERIEHPNYVVKNGLKIDYLYYLEHQIINPATQILELMLPQRKVKKLFDQFIIEEENKRKGRQSMEKWMDYSKMKNKSPKKSENEKEDNPEIKRDDSYKNLPKIGTTRRHECQNLNKWIQQSGDKKDGTDDTDWEPDVE